MVNLDVTPDFTAAVPVLSGGERSVHRRLPRRRWSTPTRTTSRRGSASPGACKPGTILRGGYGVSYNAGSYSTDRAPARRPAAVRRHRTTASARAGRAAHARRIRSPPRRRRRDDQQLRRRQGLRARPRADVERRPLARPQAGWNVGAGYTQTRGASLDIVRAPNRGPDGLRIDGVQPFLWQTSEGIVGPARRDVPPAAPAGQRDRRRRDATRSRKSRDNASTHRRRRRRSSRRTIRTSRPSGALLELRSAASALGQPSASSCRSARTAPGCTTAGVWRAARATGALATTFTWQSGTPFTPRVHGAGRRRRARHQRHAAGQLQRRSRSRSATPTIDQFFNTAAFSRAAAGHVRQRAAQPDHRAGQPAAERADLARRPAGRQPRRDASR